MFCIEQLFRFLLFLQRSINSLRERMLIRRAHPFQLHWITSSSISCWAYPKPMFASRTGFIIFYAPPNKFRSLKNNKAPHFVRGFVTALGFKPKTPSSVVRYSIQLSYAAIPQEGCKYKAIPHIHKIFQQVYIP